MDLASAQHANFFLVLIVGETLGPALIVIDKLTC